MNVTPVVRRLVKIVYRRLGITVTTPVSTEVPFIQSLRLKRTRTIPVFAHNLTGYESLIR